MRSMSNTKFGTIPNQMWACKSPSRSYNRASPRYVCDCSGAVRTVGSIFRFIWFRHFFGTVEEEHMCSSAPVSKTHVVLCLRVNAGLLDILNLYFGFAIGPMSFTFEGNSCGQSTKTSHLRGFHMLFAPALNLGKRRDPLVERIITSVGSCSADVASLICCTTGRAGVACFQIVSRVVTLWLPVERPFCFSSAEWAQE